MLQPFLRRLLFALPTRGLVCLLAASLWLAMTEVAAAQAPTTAPPSSKEDYLQYLLVGLCIALGLLAALRPSNRADPEGGAVGWFGMAMGGGHGAEAPAKPGERKKTPHRGPKLLAMSILGTFICPIISIVAILMAKEDLAAMKAARMDRNGEGLTTAAFWIAIGGLALNVIGSIITVIIVLRG